MIRKAYIGAVAAAAMTLGGMAPVNAGVISSWTNISNNNPENVGSQLQAVYTDYGLGAQFVFTNAVGIASSITDIYFEDNAGLFASLAIFLESSGVDFGVGASPSNLPSGNTANPAFNATTTPDLTADSEAGPGGVSANGINSAAESLTLRLAYKTGIDFADVESALGAGNLRIGLHVQSIGTQGGSDSYVNNGDNFQMPEPTALAVLGLALAGVGVARRRKAA